jgi:hypothetical protein
MVGFNAGGPIRHLDQLHGNPRRHLAISLFDCMD